MGAAASAASPPHPQPDDFVTWLGFLTTGDRQRLARLPPWRIVAAGLSVDREETNDRPFSLPRQWPTFCPLCPRDAVETFCTEADFRFHHDHTHHNYYRAAVLREYREHRGHCDERGHRDEREHRDELGGDEPAPAVSRPLVPIAIQALQFCGPGEIVDFSSCSRLCYIACESALCFPPFGKAAYSTINRTAVLSERASSLAQVTGNVLRSSTLRLKRARAQLTTLVRGNRVHFLSAKIPSPAQSRVCGAVLTLLMPGDAHHDHDAYRRVCRLITSEDRTASVSTVETRLSSLDHISVPQSAMQEFEEFMKGVRNDLRLSSNKSDASRTTSSSRGMDRWTLMVAQFVVAFSAYFYAADFAVAANTHLVRTTVARDRANAIKEKMKDRNPKCKAWSVACYSMQHSLERRDRHLREAKEAVKQKQNERVTSLARLAARGFAEHLGHWNVHAMLTAHGGDWEAALARLRLMMVEEEEEEE